MSLHEHIEAVKTVVQKLDDYGLAESIDAQSDWRIDNTALLLLTES